MMLCLLLGLTTLVVLLPMVPAILEWHRPTDVVPLHIDTEDALDPPFLARSFAAQLAAALARGRNRLGRTRLATAPLQGPWPLTPTERRQRRSRRVWHAQGDLTLPPHLHLLGETAATGALVSAPGRVYRALWSGAALRLAAHSTVLRWAHGVQVEVAEGCRLAGRVSADERIHVLGEASFTLMNAPAILFSMQQAPVHGHAREQVPAVVSVGLPPEVAWDAIAGRGVCNDALDIAAGSAWRGDLVCRSDLRLGSGCSVRGSLKAHGDLWVAEGARITGNVVTEGDIVLSAGCVVRGSVISETAITLAAGCVVGAPGRQATVAAPRIEVGAGVVVHGTLWAGEAGRARDLAVMEAEADDDADTPTLVVVYGASA